MCLINPFIAKGNLIDLTLSNARRFYSSKEDPYGSEWVNPFTAKGDLIDFTLSNANRFYSV